MDKLKHVVFLLCCYNLCVNAQTNFGGIHSVHSPSLLIEQQNITISPEQIKVAYNFKNTQAIDIDETLGFSCPSYPDENARLFSIMVNNMPLQYQTMQKAITNNGIDISAQLRVLGLPFEPVTAMHHFDASPNRNSIVARLHALNVIDKEDMPLWTVKTFYYWQQKFPAHSNTYIEQAYKPISNNTQLNLNSMHNLLKLPIMLVKKAVHIAIKWSLSDDIAANNLREQLERYAPQIKNYCPNKEDFDTLANSYKKTINKSAIEIKEIDFPVNINDVLISPVSNFTLKIEAPANMHTLTCWHDKLVVGQNNSLQFSAENYIPVQGIKVMYIEKF